MLKEGGLAAGQGTSKDTNWGLFITQAILLIPGLVMRDVNLNWQQILHKDISEHQSAPTFAVEFIFRLPKTL